MKKIIENNFISLFLHFIINIFIFFFGVLSFSGFLPYLILAIMTIFLYLFFGFTFKPTRNIFFDFLSFILVGIIGISFWYYCFDYSKLPDIFSIIPNGGRNDIWMLYSVYTIGVSFIEMQIYHVLRNLNYCAFLLLLGSIFPTCIFFTGLELRRFIFINVKIDLNSKILKIFRKH